MSPIEEARAELARLARMLKAQQELLEAMEAAERMHWFESPRPFLKALLLAGGTKRKLYVDRKRAAHLISPIVVEDPDGRCWYAASVEWPNTTFKWTGRNDVAPALWIETDAQLELTL